MRLILGPSIKIIRKIHEIYEELINMKVLFTCHVIFMAFAMHSSCKK